MITTSNIYEKICEVTTEDERGHWCSDLYCKVTPQTKAIVDKYKYKNLVSVFTDQITHTPWYEIPFVYPERR